MKVVGIIPARYSSNRFPGKPLVDIQGKSMIQRVYEQAKQANLLDVVVATDDQRIFDKVISFGGKVVMTASDHLCGTDRCLEALKKLDSKYDAVINIQGDEPFIQPEQINKVANCFRDSSTQIATLAKSIKDESVLLDVNSPKVSFDDKKIALTFSRKATITIEKKHFKHIGIYGYKTDVLEEIAQLPQSKNEISERLEQFRWLDNGYKILVELTDLETISIDSAADLKKIKGLA